jgi:hypothetical protein
VIFYGLSAGNPPRAVLEHGAELSEAEVLMGAFCRRVPRSDTAQEVLIVLCRWRMLIIYSYPQVHFFHLINPKDVPVPVASHQPRK